MSTPMAIVVYLTIWWIVLFAILPWGVRSQHESGEWQQGTDPGAPTTPRLLLKALVTTLVSGFLFAAFWIYVEYGPGTP